MEAAHARAAMTLVSPSPGATPRVGALPLPMRPQAPSSESKLRVLIAERRASTHSELSRRLDRAGHEVLARVTSGQGALDYAELLRPDVVLIAPALEDGPGIMAAIALTRELPGVAAVVLTTHPAAVNPAARPNWGAVALVPADAEPSDLDIELRRAVLQAQEAVAMAIEPEQVAGTQPRPADFAPIAPPTPQYQTPVPVTVSSVVREAQPGPAAIATKQAPPASPEPVAPTSARNPVSSTAGSPVQGGRSPLSFTDDDLMAVGPIIDDEDLLPASPTPALTTSAVVATPGLYDADMAVIAEAAECLLERTGLSRSDAMRLMEQEAADTGRKLIDVAQSVLGRDGEASGSEMALAS